MLMMTPPSSCAPSSSAACHDASIVPRRSTASSRSSFSIVRERRAGAGEDVGAGVVHPDVEAAERVAHGGPERSNGRLVGQVERGRTRSRPERLRSRAPPRPRPLVRAVGQRDVGAGAGRRQRDRAADAARRAGHEHGAAGQGERRRFRHEPFDSSQDRRLHATCPCSVSRWRTLVAGPRRRRGHRGSRGRGRRWTASRCTGRRRAPGRRR